MGPLNGLKVVDLIHATSLSMVALSGAQLAAGNDTTSRACVS